jgi:hypothetical protein
MTRCQTFTRSPLPKELEKNVRLLCRQYLLGSCVAFCLVSTDSNVSFAYAAWPPPLENLDEELEHCLCRISFMLPSYFCVVVLVLIGRLFSQALMLSEDQHKKQAIESTQAAKSAKKSQAEKIAQLEKACADEAGKGNCYRWVMEAIRKTQDVH